MKVAVSVLFARHDSCYTDLAADVWDMRRDARNYVGANPVVCHPPCRGWGRLRKLAKPRPDEKALALFAVKQVRRCGGVLEHPWGSTLWPAAGLPHPGMVDAWGGWTLLIDQGWWGHPAPKPTYLYIVGIERDAIGELPVQLHRAAGRTLDLSPADRERTPPRLAAWLVDLASRCTPPQLQPSAAAVTADLEHPLQLQPAGAVTASCADSYTDLAAPLRLAMPASASYTDLAAPLRAASKRAAFKAWAGS